MSWEHKFYDWILERGADYYHDGYVNGVIVRPDGKVSATVRFYSVNVLIQDGELKRKSCDCPYARKGAACKHVAALIYYLEDHNPELFVKKPKPVPVTRRIINPFAHFSEDARYYFDLNEIIKPLKIYEDNYQRALYYKENGVVTLDEFDLDYQFNKDREMIATVTGTFHGDFNEFPIILSFTRNRLLNGECSVQACSGTYNSVFYTTSQRFCDHLLALLLCAADYIRQHNPGDYTNQQAAAFMNHFAGSPMLKGKAVNDVVLEPRLESDGNNLNMTVKVGTNRLYVVKNFTDLINSCELRTEMKLGTKNSLDFNVHDFDERSRRLYQLIKAYVTDERFRVSYQYHSSYITVNDSYMPLYGHYIDEFFEIFKSSRVECKNAPAVVLMDADPRFNMELSQVIRNGYFEGIKVKGDLPQIIKGERNDYCFTPDCLYRLTVEYSQVIAPLIQARDRYYNDEGGYDLIIGTKNIGTFANQLVPILDKSFNLIRNDWEEIEKHIPPQAIFDFYLDIEEGIVTCKTIVSYGDYQKILFFDSPVEPFRDLEQEERVKDIVRKYFTAFNMEERLLCTNMNDDDALFNLLNEGLGELMEVGNVNTTEAFKRLKIRKKTGYTVGVSLESNLLDLDIHSDDLSDEELLQILYSYRKNRKYHRLKNGDFIRLDDDVRSLNDLFESLNVPLKDFVHGKMMIPAYRSLYLNKLIEEKEFSYINRDLYFRKLLNSFDDINTDEFSTPESLSNVLREYQKEGFRWLKTLDKYHFGGILADEMGLGKTLQIIAVLLDDRERNGFNTSLIVAPASLVYNWQMEIERFAPQLSSLTVTGNQQERANKIKTFSSFDVLITSYDLLKRDTHLYEDLKFRYLVIDEAQYIKTYTTANAKSVKILKADTRYALTGTPVENNLSELWSIFDYLMPGFLYGHEQFKNMFENAIVRNDDRNMMERLKQMVSPFILRRRKKDVLKDLPNKLEETVYVKFADKQQKLYDGQVVRMTRKLEASSPEYYNTNKIEILAELTRIRQICCEPSVVFANYDGESAKREACLELVKSAVEEGHKILIFSQFVSMLEILEKELTNNGISYYLITGKTEKEERLEMVNAFNKDDTNVFLISLKAGGTGLNLTGADIVIHYDPWWNKAAQDQATDRAHRIGQKNVVTVYKLIARDTIEDRIVELQSRKQELAEEILNAENGTITRLTRNELLDILS
ncbi:MAG: DEAD/DEAH box helicase [Erysipelotrichaceae bacterium]|nr:DEAD/DEAH box helicase [Erysipelotrichaceae bacterium]